jgi:hypothetical protein
MLSSCVVLSGIDLLVSPVGSFCTSATSGLVLMCIPSTGPGTVPDLGLLKLSLMDLCFFQEIHKIIVSGTTQVQTVVDAACGYHGS